jgi:hypothetical protein
MTTTKIRPQTVPADIPKDEARIKGFYLAPFGADTDTHIRNYWVNAWQRATLPLAPRPTFRLIFNSEWHGTFAEADASATARAGQLRALAQWSVSEADLDWDHLREIDRAGWGTSA